MKFKVGDKVRLTGKDWEGYEEADVSPGVIVEITEIDDFNIWAGEAGTVGNRNGLYSESNPEVSGDYSCEPVTDSFVKTVSAFSSAVSHEDIEDIARLGEQLGVEEPLQDWEKALLWSPFEQSVRRHTDRIATLLIEKNKQYSNSALDPIRVFSKADRTEQLRVRADDKLSRIRNGDTSEDAVLDLCGYLILLRIAAESE